MSTAEENRDSGIARTSSANAQWMDAALYRISQLTSGTECTGEQIREGITRRVGSPNHVNAWGALIRTAASRGILARTGDWVPMTDPNSHARLTPVWKRV